MLSAAFCSERFDWLRQEEVTEHTEAMMTDWGGAGVGGVEGKN